MLFLCPVVIRAALQHTSKTVMCDQKVHTTCFFSIYLKDTSVVSTSWDIQSHHRVHSLLYDQLETFHLQFHEVQVPCKGKQNVSATIHHLVLLKAQHLFNQTVWIFINAILKKTHWLSRKTQKVKCIYLNTLPNISDDDFAVFSWTSTIFSEICLWQGISLINATNSLHLLFLIISLTSFSIQKCLLIVLQT